MPIRPIGPKVLPPPTDELKDRSRIDAPIGPAPVEPSPLKTTDDWGSPQRLPRGPILRPPKLPPLRPPPTEPVKPPTHIDRPPVWDGIGTIPPTFRLEFPDGLSRPPGIDDITVLWGLDNRTPDEVLDVVTRNLSGDLHSENRGFMDRSVRIAHRAFTVAVNNAFTPNTPFQKFRAGFAADAKFEMLGTLAMLHPTLVRVTLPHESEPRIYELTPDGYQQRSSVPYPIIMETPLEFEPARVAPSYPAWNMPALAAPLTVVTEPT